MNIHNYRLLATSASVLFALPAAFAQANGTWNTLATPASWATPGNWVSNQIASGANQTADFSTLNPTANTTVTLDGARTIGNLIFGDTDTSTAATWFLLNGTGGSLELAGTTPTISVNSLAASRFGNIQATLSGTSGFTKNGAGVLLLNQPSNTISGPIILNQGNIQLNSASLTNATSLTLNAGSLIVATTSANAVGGTINFAGGSFNFNNAPGSDYSTQFSTAPGQIYRVNSITGAGVVTLAADLTSSGGSFIKGNTGTVNLTGANTFTGGVTVNQGTLATGSTGTFGSGDVTVSLGASLTAGNSNSFFDNGQLTFSRTSATGSINLNFSGSDTIGSVFESIGGTSLPAGTYDASQLNAFFTGGNAIFTGAGSLSIAPIPEPSAFAALAGLGALALTATRRRRRS